MNESKPAPWQFPITLGVVLAAIALTSARWLGRDVDRLLMNGTAFEGQPWRLGTSALFHADAIHLIFNLIWTWVFGSAIERRFGSGWLGALMVGLALGSTAAQWGLSAASVGLSGVGYGLCGFLWAGQKCDAPYAKEAVSSQVFGLFVVWFFVCIGATISGVWAIANVAHGAGAILGVAVGFAAHGRGARRYAATLATVALTGLSVALGGPLRQYVNAEGKADDEGRRADALFDEGDFEGAIAKYKLAVAADPSDARLWHNLSVSYDRASQPDLAVDAARRATQVAPTESRYRAGLITSLARAASKSMNDGHYEQAANLFEEASELDPTDSSLAFNAGVALDRNGNHGRALAFYEKALAGAPKETRYKRAVAATLAHRGDQLADEGKKSEAIALYERAVSTFDGSPHLWHNFGVLLQKTDRHRAQKYFDRAERLMVGELDERGVDVEGLAYDELFKRFDELDGSVKTK